MNKVEILSPAGSMDSLKAAINASCDAIYMGGSKFGARAYADNPEQDILLNAIDYAHIHDKHIYLTVNTLLKNDELKDELYDYLYKYYTNGLDAVIVQDLGVMNFIHEHFPQLPIHASTQMTLTMAEGANVLKDYGVTRFVPSRELSLAELKDMRKKTDLEIEVFVHGSLCYSYSGQCLMSSVFSGRSGNRGRCSQPCRLPFTLVDGGDNRLNPTSSKTNNNFNHSPSSQDNYLISPKDIATLDLIPDLVDAGINSFKIEGRMKRPEYTAVTTYTYKKYLEKYLELGRDKYERYLYDESKEYRQDKLNLLDIYNRGGFSDGYFYKRNGKNMITLNKPNHSGVKVGSVSKVGKKHLWIDLVEDINKGDVLRIVGQKKEDSYEYTTGVAVKSGATTSTNYDRRVSLEEGDRVYRLRNNALIDKLNNDFILEDKQIKIDGLVDVVVGRPLEITLIKGQVETSITGDLVEEAKNQPMTEDRIRNQVLKINDTNFVFDNLDINITGRPFIPVSKLNELRRAAIIELERDLASRFNRQEVSNDGIGSRREEENNKINIGKGQEARDASISNKYGIHVLVHTKDQLYEAISRPEVGAIYVDSDISRLDEIKTLLKDIKKSGKKSYLYMPHIFRKVSYNYFRQEYDKDQSLFSSDGLDGYLIRNLEEYEFIKKHSRKTKSKGQEIIADYNLYTMNEEAANLWNKLGIDKLTAPVELNKYELQDMAGLYDNIIVYGRIPLMVTAQCPMKTVSGGDNNHLSKPLNTYCCGQDKDNLGLVDRLNVKFPVVRNCRHCYNTIYNSLALSLLRNTKEVSELNPKNIRLNFTIETREETEEILNKFIQVYYYGNKKVNDIDDFTRIHLNRGIE